MEGSVDIRTEFRAPIGILTSASLQYNSQLVYMRTIVNMLQSFSSFIIFYSLLWTSLAHMEMSSPLPMRSSLDPSVPEPMRDYNLKSPLTANGSNYPCHGYQNERPIVSKATYVAGKTYSMSIVGSASHGGGSCQLSLSYDNGGTFKVIKSMIGGCPLTLNYDFTVPAFAPSGNALFAWTWFNHVGNREMYMNCAWVTIAGSSAARRKAKRQSTFTSIASLPNIWRANIAGLSTCTTSEGTDPVFPNPGPDVIYAAGLSASSPATGGICDAATPQGQTFQASSDTTPTVPDTVVSPAASSVVSSAPSLPPAVGPIPSSATSSEATPTSSSDLECDSAEESGGSSLTTSVGGSSTPISASASTSTSATVSSPSPAPEPASSAQSIVPPPLIVSSVADAASSSTPTVSTTMTTPCEEQVTETVTGTAGVPDAGAPTAGAEDADPGPDVPVTSSASFVSDSDIQLYLPCVAGTWLCLSATEYRICDQSIIGIPFNPVMQYVGPSPVAPGMQCLPYLAPLPNTDAVTRMSNSSGAANVPDGFFRSDRYVLA